MNPFFRIERKSLCLALTMSENGQDIYQRQTKPNELLFETSKTLPRGTPALFKRGALVPSMHEPPNPPETRGPAAKPKKLPEPCPSSPSRPRVVPKTVRRMQASSKIPGTIRLRTPSRGSSAVQGPLQLFLVVGNWLFLVLLVIGCFLFSGLILKFKSFLG